jgi:putative transposase
MNNQLPLLHGAYYHIFNRGVNGCPIFRDYKDYNHFLGLYDRYISLVAETFAWTLLGNHFHFLILVKPEQEIDYLRPLDYSENDQPAYSKILPDDNRWRLLSKEELQKLDRVLPLKKPIPYRMFAHLFNAYTHYYNIRYQRTGSLFEKNFRRKQVVHESYFKNLVIYIHKNPLLHGFTDDFKDYPWSSYGSLKSIETMVYNRERVMQWFNDKDNFINQHQAQIDYSFIEHLIIE